MRADARSLLAASVVLVAILVCTVAHADGLCGTPAIAPSVRLQQLQVAKAQETFRDSQYLALRDAAGITWTFTQPANPAHPAVVCRRIVGTEGKLELETNADCRASRQACDAMMADFAKLNAAMIEALKSRK
jgi:hypothetical protein